jgi:hypothetical protein
MIGNEADIVEVFVRENCRYLDHLLIAQHNALDGTGEILAALAAEGLPITVSTVTSSVYEQTKVTNELLRQAIEGFAPDWVVPLDVDEFIDAGGRADLEDRLAAISHSHGLLPWANHLPTSFDDPGQGNPLKRIGYRFGYSPPPQAVNPWAWKAIVNAQLLGPYLDRYEIEKGSHRLVFRTTKEPIGQPVQTLPDACLRHFPIRSYDQLAVKVGIGQAQTLMAKQKNERAGGHWPQIVSAILRGATDVGLLQIACGEYVDLGRVSGKQAQSLPTVFDPFPTTSELTLLHLRLPAAGFFVRWLNRYFDNRLDDADADAIDAAQ